MATRLKAARVLGLMDTEAEKAAWQVWVRGNKAVHDDPTVTQDA